MTRRIETYGQVNSGKIVAARWEQTIEAVKQWQDCMIRIVIEPIYPGRSNPQNRYYWGVLLNEFCKGWEATTGEYINPEDAHAFLKSKFNRSEVTIKGETMLVPRSTTELNTAEFETYLAICRQFAWEWFGIQIPLPNECTDEVSY